VNVRLNSAVIAFVLIEAMELHLPEIFLRKLFQASANVEARECQLAITENVQRSRNLVRDGSRVIRASA